MNVNECSVAMEELSEYPNETNWQWPLSIISTPTIFYKAY